MTEALLKKYLDQLPKIENFDTIKVLPNGFIDGGQLKISAEEGDAAADYYGEYRGNDPWINPTLEDWAEERGCYWEWDHPGAIALVATSSTCPQHTFAIMQTKNALDTETPDYS